MSFSALAVSTAHSCLDLFSLGLVGFLGMNIGDYGADWDEVLWEWGLRSNGKESCFNGIKRGFAYLTIGSISP